MLTEFAYAFITVDEYFFGGHLRRTHGVEFGDYLDVFMGYCHVDLLHPFIILFVEHAVSQIDEENSRVVAINGLFEKILYETVFS